MEDGGRGGGSRKVEKRGKGSGAQNAGAWLQVLRGQAVFSSLGKDTQEGLREHDLVHFDFAGIRARLSDWIRYFDLTSSFTVTSHDISIRTYHSAGETNMAQPNPVVFFDISLAGKFLCEKGQRD